MRFIALLGMAALASPLSACIALPLAGLGAALGAVEVVTVAGSAVAGSAASASTTGAGAAASTAGATQSGPGYQQSAGPGYVSQSGPGYQQSAGPGGFSQSGPGYQQQAGPGYVSQSGPGYKQGAGFGPSGAQRAAAAGAAAILVSQAARSRPTTNCRAECSGGAMSIGCPAGSEPVCQCEKKPYAACRKSGQK